MPAERDDAGWVCLGLIGRPKGVRGAMRITTYTARPEDVAAYGPVYDRPDGQARTLGVSETGPGWVVAHLAGVDDRNAAHALTGTRLYVPRAALPEAEDEAFYHADLIGLRAERVDGGLYGTVRAVWNHGAGDLLEIAPAAGGETEILPFTRAVVPEVDIAAGRLLVAPPETIDAGEDGGERDDGAGGDGTER